MSLLPEHLFQSILGRRLAKRYELRTLRPTDLKRFAEDVERYYYNVQYRSCHIELVIAERDGGKRPVFALVASKGASRKTTIHVLATGKVSSLQPQEYLRFLATGLLATQYYGLHTDASRICVNKISPQLQGYFESLGYSISKRKGLLYAVREINSTKQH